MTKELVDLYDSNRTPLGRTHDRANKLADGEFIIVVGIWIFNSKNEILLTKRHPNKKFAPNLWENTGGHVSAGETSVAAVVRELREETGIIAEMDEVIYLGTAKVPPFFGDNYYVRKDISLSDVTLQDGETVDVKWVSYTEFERMISNGELAPSVAVHLAPFKDKFESALGLG